MYQNFFWCSQNVTKHILVLKKSILKPIFIVNPLFKNATFGVNPLLEKVPNKHHTLVLSDCRIYYFRMVMVMVMVMVKDRWHFLAHFINIYKFKTRPGDLVMPDPIG